MNFKKTEWHDGGVPAIDAGNLNRIENGIEESFTHCDNKHNWFIQVRVNKIESPKGAEVIVLHNGDSYAEPNRSVVIPKGISLVKITLSIEGRSVGQRDAYVERNGEHVVDVGWHSNNGGYRRSSSVSVITEVEEGDKFWVDFDAFNVSNSWNRMPEKTTLLVEEIPLGDSKIKRASREEIQ